MWIGLIWRLSILAVYFLSNTFIYFKHENNNNAPLYQSRESGQVHHSLVLVSLNDRYTHDEDKDLLKNVMLKKKQMPLNDKL